MQPTNEKCVLAVSESASEGTDPPANQILRALFFENIAVTEESD